MRINQYVAAATGMSRRAADISISGGHVTVGGVPAKLGQSVDATDDVRLDGLPLAPLRRYTYVVLNKPAGYISSRARQSPSVPTLYELLPPAFRSLRIAGRLDRDSSGLILLTDDGPFLHRQTHPSWGKSKVYELKLTRPLAAADRRQLESGVPLEDGPSVVKVLQAGSRNIRVSLSEGRNRQLRRTLGALGYTVERLHRTQLGSYTLADLPPGQWRQVTGPGA